MVFYEAPVPIPSPEDDTPSVEGAAQDTETSTTEPAAEPEATPTLDHTHHEPQAVTKRCSEGNDIVIMSTHVVSPADWPLLAVLESLVLAKQRSKYVQFCYTL